MAKPDLSVDRLRELLDYNPETGVFSRKVRTSVRIKLGPINNKPQPTGHINIRVNGYKYAAHRLAWLYVYGKWPVHEIDHINGNPGDNRICNLRDIPHSENVKNIRRPRKDNKHGYMGVIKNGTIWTALIHVDGKKVIIGYFKDPQEAHLAYVEAKRRLHKSCTI